MMLYPMGTFVATDGVGDEEGGGGVATGASVTTGVEIGAKVGDAVVVVFGASQTPSMSLPNGISTPSSMAESMMKSKRTDVAA